MTKRFFSYTAIAGLIVSLFVASLWADGRRLTYEGVDNISELAAAPASGDFVPVFDTSANDVLKVDAKWFQVTDGTGPTAAELDYLTGVTAGTAAASKAVVLDSSSQIDALDIIALELNNVAVDEALMAKQGRGSFVICGEADTVNNNTVYYGPDITLLGTSGFGGLTCDINAVGNTTEATADAPIYTNQAVAVMGMTCRNEADANADISFTLRTAAGATTPSVTCTISDGERDCVADVQTTTDIAAGATVAIAAASTGDIAAANGFVCEVEVAY